MDRLCSSLDQPSLISRLELDMALWSRSRDLLMKKKEMMEMIDCDGEYPSLQGEVMENCQIRSL